MAVSDVSAHWEHIKDAWAEFLPILESGRRIDPYFINWEFTPIEEQAWNCIRRMGLPLYPQIPIAGYFLDFGDPHKKIGVELDGKDFHDCVRDTKRDERLWRHGWRIFRISGAESFRWLPTPCEPGFAEYAERDSREYNSELSQFAENSGDGVFWALDAAFYHPSRYNENEKAIALWSLRAHRLIEFPLPLDDLEDFE